MMDFFLITTQLSLHKMLTDGLEWCGLLWCFYQLFGLSFWRHPFTAEHPLVSKWRNATFLQIWWRKQTHLHLGWPEGEFISANLHFWVNYSFKWVYDFISYYYSLYETVDGSKSLPVCVHHSTAHIHRNGHLSQCVKEEVWPSRQYMLKQE